MVESLKIPSSIMHLAATVAFPTAAGRLLLESSARNCCADFAPTVLWHLEVKAASADQWLGEGLKLCAALKNCSAPESPAHKHLAGAEFAGRLHMTRRVARQSLLMSLLPGKSRYVPA
jgi:hypothetical protein